MDPLLNTVYLTPEGLGMARFEIGDVKDYVIQDIKNTIKKPACIYESATLTATRYYFQYFKATVFMCVVKMSENKWYLKDTQFNPATEITETILLKDKLLYAK